MAISIEFARKTALAYAQVCKPLCRQMGLPQTAFDILMFLSNNPGYDTASDIVEIRRIKASLVSMNVERLVQEGYLSRREVQGDRRKTRLILTEKAQPVVEQGRRVQQAFFQGLFRNTDEPMRQAFFAAMEIIEKNLDAILEEGK